jgi:hypothetical protein
VMLILVALLFDIAIFCFGWRVLGRDRRAARKRNAPWHLPRR